MLGLAVAAPVVAKAVSHETLSFERIPPAVIFDPSPPSYYAEGGEWGKSHVSDMAYKNAQRMKNTQHRILMDALDTGTGTMKVEFKTYGR